MPPKKSKGKKARQASLPKLPMFRVLLWGCVILLTGLTLFLALRLPMRQQAVRPENASQPPATAQMPARPPAEAQEQVVRPRVDSANETVAPKPGQGGYEAQQDDFEAKVRGVDLAILMALASQGESQDIMRHRAVEERSHEGQEFFYQNLTIAMGQDVFPFLSELKRNLDQLGPEVAMVAVNENPRDLEISIQGSPTHHLFLPLQLTPEPVETVVAAPRLVIVIDDLGESMAVAKRLADLPFKVSFSVLPHNTKARQVAELARREGLELLLHLPSEPDGYPKTANSGPGTLRVDMTAAQLEQALVDNLARLPDVDGVNNHMGSKLTRDRKAMRIVLAHLHGNGKFFLDSLTTPKSCVKEVSKALGMRYYRRHIFLDNTATEHSILLQLRKAESLARRTGVAVAIGHPYPATLSALESWAKTRDMRIVVCRIQDI
jgi:polysaccharide deacetylase 2 family uncharacterized protein YibQ